MMSSLATYQFSFTSKIGQTAMMVKIGTPQAPMSLSNDNTYDFVALAFDTNETKTIKLDPVMRNGTNRFCGNGSYTLKGGNDNCTLYVGMQCSGLCVYNLSVTVVAPASLVSFPEPLLLGPGDSFTDSVTKGKGKFYFLPYTRTQAPTTLVLALDKMGSGDSLIVGRRISNAYLAYSNWSYPNTTKYDYISQSQASSNEVLEISGASLSSNCLGNASCALIIGVFGNSA